MRLERSQVFRIRTPIANFNSIKVRLELGGGSAAWWLIGSFQFHKGAIRTRKPLHKVLWVLHFNSIKVRLERDAWKAKNPAPSFQFHKGAIRT